MLMGFVKPHDGNANVMGYDIRTEHYGSGSWSDTCRNGRPLREHVCRGQREIFRRLIGVKTSTQG
jgi:hypothetical protein